MDRRKALVDTAVVEAFVREHHGKLSFREMARRLGTYPTTVQRAAERVAGHKPSRRRHRRWRPHEVKIIETYYPREGPEGCLKRLSRHRTYNAVHAKATRLGITIAELRQGYVPLAEAVLMLGRADNYVRARAKRDGVFEMGAREASVPLDWVYAWIAGEKSGHRWRELREAGWLDTTEAAARLGVARTTINKAYAGTLRTPVAGPIRKIRSERVGHRRLLHPVDVDLAAAKTRRPLPHGYLSIREVARRSGVSAQHAHRLYEGRKLYVRGTYGMVALVRESDLEAA